MKRFALWSVIAVLALAGTVATLACLEPDPAPHPPDPGTCPTSDVSTPTATPVLDTSTPVAQQIEGPTRIVIPGLASGSGQTLPLTGPDPALAALRATLADELANTSVPGRFAISVTDLHTGATISVNGDRPQRAACVMNLFAIILALRDVQEGFYALDDVDWIIRQTIWASDASAARLLYQKEGSGEAVVGVARVAALQREVMGLEATIIDHPPAFGGESLGISADNWTTTNEMNRVLAMLYAGDLLGPELTGYLLEAMTHVKPGLNYLTAALPSAATVSHKNGFFPAWDGYVDNDTAIVRFGPNLEHAYAITFMSEAVPTEYQEIWLAQRLIRLTWAHFEARYSH